MTRVAMRNRGRIRACFSALFEKNDPNFSERSHMANEPKNDFGYGEQFEPDVFWEAHGRKIIWGLVGLVVLTVAGYYWQATAQAERENMATRFSEAETPDALESLIRDYGTKPVAANALLKLGTLQFEAGRFDEAEQVYKRFIQGFPSHPLVPQARYGLAVVAEARGQHGEASQLYQNFVQQYVTSPLVPAARVGLARCAEALGQKEQALQLYQDAVAAASVATASRTFWGEVASARQTMLTRDKSKDAPAPQGTSTNNIESPKIPSSSTGE
jgi:tetratricopeptide (TPR) repeat protein